MWIILPTHVQAMRRDLENDVSQNSFKTPETPIRRMRRVPGVSPALPPPPTS